MSQIEKSFNEIYGDMYVLKDTAFKLFKMGWQEAVDQERKRQIKVISNLISHIKEDDDFNQGKLEAYIVAKAFIESEAGQ